MLSYNARVPRGSGRKLEYAGYTSPDSKRKLNSSPSPAAKPRASAAMSTTLTRGPIGPYCQHIALKHIKRIARDGMESVPGALEHAHDRGERLLDRGVGPRFSRQLAPVIEVRSGAVQREQAAAPQPGERRQIQSPRRQPQVAGVREVRGHRQPLVLPSLIR